MIYVVFEDDVDLYFARTRVLERMNLRRARCLPRASRRRSGPTPPASGHVFWYTVESPTHSLRDLRTPAGLVRPLPAQRRAGRGRSGLGRRLRAAVSDRRRSRTGCAPTTSRSSAVVAAVRDSNVNVGGNVLESNGAWLIVRGVGLIAIGRRRRSRSSSAPTSGVPVYVEQVGDGPARRRVPRRVAREGTTRGRRRRRRRAHRREHQGGHRRRQGAHRADCSRACRRASRSCPSTTAPI